MRNGQKYYHRYLNPSIDVTLWTDGLDIDNVNRVVRENREAGGKGINVSRVAKSFGAPTICISVAGRENCREFSDLLDSERLEYRLIEIEDAIRENLTIRHGGYTLKINRKGPAAPPTVIDELYPYPKLYQTGDIAVLPEAYLKTYRWRIISS